MELKLDLHVHTSSSYDSSTDMNEAMAYTRKIGLDGVAITDHDVPYRGKSDWKGLIVVPGIEISTKRGHLLALGIDEPIRRGLSVEETIEAVKNLGGITILAHPFRFIHGIKPSRNEIFDVDGIEVRNGKEPARSRRKADMLAQRWGRAKTGGSDAHRPDEIGSAYTIIEVSSPGLGEILEAIRHGRTRVFPI